MANVFINDFFRNVLKVLPKDDQYNVIRSNLIQRYEPMKACEENGICITCGCYSEIYNKYEILPHKKPNKFIRKLKSKMFNYNKGLKTPYQLTALKTLAKLKDVQTIFTTCQLCKYSYKKKIKQSKTKWKKTNLTPNRGDTENKVKKSKKSRKSDGFAGLNKNAVLSIKRKKETTNPEEAVTSKRRKIDNNVTINDSDVVETIDNSIIYIDKTPTKLAQLKEPDVINLITPTASDTNLLTPVKMKKNVNSLKGLSSNKNENTKRKKANHIISVDKTPTKFAQVKDSDVINLVTPTASVINLVTKKKNTNSLKGLSSKKKENTGKKKANKVLASDKITPEKSKKKLNSLQNIFNNQANKVNSNLQQFLNSIT